MPKVLYVCLYLLDICIVAYSIWDIRKKTGNLAKSIRNLLILGLVTTALYTLAVISNTYLTISIFYSLMFIGFDWLCYWLLVFSYLFTDHSKHQHKLKLAISLLLLCDSMVQLINPFTEFSNTYRTIYDGDALYLSIVGHLPYLVHLAICYAMIGIVMYLIIYCACKRPHMYRYKYELVGISLAVIIAINALFVFTSAYIDLSILTFGLLACFFCYLTFRYKPKGFFSRVKSHFFEVTDAAVVIFDNEEKFSVCNQKARELFFSDGNKENGEPFLIQQFLVKWKLNNMISLDQDYYCEGRICLHNENRYFNIDYKKLFDDKRRYLGSYLIFHETTEKKHLENYNRLTGIYNRNYFCKEVDRRLKENGGEGFAMIAFDIQNFKGINEAVGTTLADEVLKCIANILFEHRPMDSVFGHSSIDRFMIFVRESDLRLDELENEFLKRCHEAGLYFGNRLYFGIYRVKKTDTSATKMYDYAMLALKNAKVSKLETRKYYTPAMSQDMLDQQYILNDMNQALEEGLFEMFLQPQVDSVTEKVIGAEALVRWNHPQKGYISPAVFIPVFESNGFVSRMDEYVWEQACKCLQRWKQKCGEWPERSISVNISRIDLFYLNVCDIFEKLVETYEIPKNLLKLEITESAYIQDEGIITTVIQRLQNLGFIIEMDDFGSGYSSLNSLMNAPVDILKLDMRFLLGNDPRNRSKTIIKSIVEMASKIGLKVVAEGVETEEQALFMKSVGCDYIQGYYYAKPMDVASFERTYN